MPSKTEIDAAAEAYFTANPYTHNEWKALSEDNRAALRCLFKITLEAAEKVREDDMESSASVLFEEGRLEAKKEHREAIFKDSGRAAIKELLKHWRPERLIDIIKVES